jgi:hypothetical protein
MGKKGIILHHKTDTTLTTGEINSLSESKRMRPFKTIRPLEGVSTPASDRKIRLFPDPEALIVLGADFGS